MKALKNGWILLSILLILLTSTSVAYSDELKECAYFPKRSSTNPSPAVEVSRDCGVRVNGKLVLSREFIDKLSFDEHGLSSVMIDGSPHYVKPGGATLPVLVFENWADDYVEGLVRSVVNGKIAYYDRAFRQVIPPRYDWGAPFENGRALVCKGCKVQPSDEEGHRRVTGGVWGYIDKKGREVVPVRFTQSEVERK